MAHFYGEVNGTAATPATRTGTANVGISAHIRGWQSGIKVRGYVEDGEDHFAVYLTSGSGGAGSDELLGIYTKFGEVK